MASNPDTTYVCSLNIRSIKRKPIPAGHTFNKSDMVKKTFESLLAKGYITVYNAVKPIQVVKPSSNNATVIGPASHVPSAALRPTPPIPLSETEKEAKAEARNAERLEKENKKKELLAALEEYGIKASKNNSISKLQKRLDAAKAKDTEQPQTAASEPVVEHVIEAVAKTSVPCVWDFDPEKISGIPMEQLQCLYKEKCTEYKIAIETVSDRNILISKMSSQFVQQIGR